MKDKTKLLELEDHCVKAREDLRLLRMQLKAVKECYEGRDGEPHGSNQEPGFYWHLRMADDLARAAVVWIT